MTPKKSKGGGKRAREDDGASILLMNNRPIEAVPLKMDVAKETQKLDTMVVKCKIRVAWVDLLNIAKRLKFSNDRPENEAETNKLVGCFQLNRIVSMKDVAAIPLIMKWSHITNLDSLKPNFDEPEEIVELEIEDREGIVVASGQHRLAALKKYKHNVNQEHITTFNEYHEEMGRVKGLLDEIGKWAVIIYDEDIQVHTGRLAYVWTWGLDVRIVMDRDGHAEKLLANGTTLTNHLSRNSMLHEYKEMEEEVLITILKKLRVVHDASPADKHDDLTTEHLREVHTMQEKNAHLHKVLQQEQLCMLLATQLMPLARIFNINCLCSKALFPTYVEVSKLLDASKSGDKTVLAKLAELRTMIECTVKVKDEGGMSVWAGVLQLINKLVDMYFNGIKTHIRDMTTAYVSPLSKYQHRVVKTLQDVWGLTDDEEVEDNEILAHLDCIIARVALYLTPQNGKTQAPLPLLGFFLMDFTWESLVGIQEGISEVAHWFETLLDSYQMLHPKTHVMDNWSNVMLGNITHDACFLSGGNSISRKQCTPPCIKDKKELNSAYETSGKPSPHNLDTYLVRQLSATGWGFCNEVRKQKRKRGEGIVIRVVKAFEGSEGSKGSEASAGS
ncbi:hypothetical protein EDD22DRAFT_853683 [Suillus occidentalis]|nr:hypothetical protein EDD22DRAFT_853683 [Suillus occidentalis]